MKIHDKVMIETARLILRPWHEDDADDLYKYASDSRVSELALWPRHTSREMSLYVIKEIFMPNPDSFAMVLKNSGEAGGCIGLVPEGSEHFAPQPGEREVGYWLGRPLWGMGLTTEALDAFIGCCRYSLGLKSLLITTDAANIASQRVAAKCGFKFICDYDCDGIASKAYRLQI